MKYTFLYQSLIHLEAVKTSLMNAHRPLCFAKTPWAIPPKTRCLLDKKREKKDTGSKLWFSHACMVLMWPHGSLVSTPSTKNQLPVGFFCWAHPDWPEIGHFMPFFSFFYRKNLTFMDIKYIYKNINSAFTFVADNYVPTCFRHYFKTHYTAVEWELVISMNLVRFAILIKKYHILWLLQLWEAAKLCID